MASKHKDEYTGETATDLAMLWKEAEREYYETTKLQPTKITIFRNMDDIMKDQDVQKGFQKVCSVPLYRYMIPAT